MGIEVIIGETDTGYLLDKITKEDFLIVLDATTRVSCGRICCFPLCGEASSLKDNFQHDISLISLCRIYYPSVAGIIIGIGVAEIELHYGLSRKLSSKIKHLRKKLIKTIRKEISTIQSGT
jgi:Ni,Fe-hydrogenase maturation factor